MNNIKQPQRRTLGKKIVIGALGSAALVVLPHRLPRKWSKPLTNSVITPAHAQTSEPDNLCVDGTSVWLMSDYQETGTAFTQGSPQSQVTITITGNQIDLTTDWFVINSTSNAASRGRVTDTGTIDLTTGEAATSPTGSPTASPTHGAVENLANNLPQTFSLDCLTGNSFTVQDSSGVYSFRLTRQR